MSRKKLQEIGSRLSETDTGILFALKLFRFLRTGQIRQLFFAEANTIRGSTRNANRHLQRLQGIGLVDALPRRVGGMDGGSEAAVWFLKEQGYRCLALSGVAYSSRHRAAEPSDMFLKHALAIADCVIETRNCP